MQYRLLEKKTVLASYKTINKIEYKHKKQVSPNQRKDQNQMISVTDDPHPLN